MTKQEFAQTIKVKYPQYQNMDDNTLVDKIISKYPQYKSQITEEKTGFISGIKSKVSSRGEELGNEATKALGSGTVKSGARLGLRTAGEVAGSIGDILVEGLKAIAPEKVESALKSGVQKVGGAVMSTDIAQKISDWSERNPESAKDLENILDIVALVPAGKAGQVGLKGIEKAGKTTGKAALKVASEAKPAIGSALATGGAIGERAGIRVMSASLEPTIEQAGKKLTYKATTPLKKRLEMAALGTERAPKTVADVAAKYNLAGLLRSEVGVRAKRISNELFEKQVKPYLKNIKEKVSKDKVFKSIEAKIKKIPDVTQKKSLLNALDSLKDDYSNVKNWSYREADLIKSSLSNKLPNKVWKGQDIAGDVNNLRKLLSDELRIKIRQKLPNKIKDIYDDYGSLKEISKRGSKALTRGFDSGILGLTSEAIRAGAFPISTIGGLGFKKVGTAIKKAGQKLLK